VYYRLLQISPAYIVSLSVVKYLYLILLYTLGLSASLYAQKGRDETLANSYYQTGEYEKAASLYQALWDKNNYAAGFYRPLFKSLIELKKYEDAEKAAKKQSKKYPDIIQYQIDIGYIYHLQGANDKYKETYDKLIKNLKPSDTEIQAAAAALADYREYSYQIQLYERATKLLKGNADYTLPIADAYVNMGDYGSAARSYIEHIDKQPADGQAIKNTIQTNRNATKLMVEIEKQLYNRLQKSPERESYAELLAWIYIQNKDFEGALAQVKALDRRRNDNGIRVLEVARMAQTEGYYDDAVKGYEYVLTKTPKSIYYFQAKTDLLNCRKEKIAKTINYSQDDLLALKTEYSVFILENGRNPNTAKSMKEMADLVGFYLHQPDTAIMICQDIVDMPGLPQQIIDDAKISLGDFYLMSGEVWESSLLYSQVDKEEKDGPLGEEARFKNAKLSYYKGDFDWAQEQLQVLKSSTSELIANDAINLSVFIIDNLGLDTVPEPMQLFASADLLMFQNLDIEATKKLDSITIKYPGHALYDDIEFAKAQIYVRQHEYARAVPLLEDILKSYAHDLKGDDATFLLAELCEHELHNVDRARDLYKTIITDYNSSLLVIEARKRYRILRGDKID
jgi:tetratricopeptide (TPR) repeat protein